MDTRKGEEGEGEADGESNMETYNIVCRIDSQWELTVCLRELTLGLRDTLEGWGGEGGGRGPQEGGTWVYLWPILTDVWQKTTQFCKAVILQLKNKAAKIKMESKTM